jgi:hypothetical protein
VLVEDRQNSSVHDGYRIRERMNRHAYMHTSHLGEGETKLLKRTPELLDRDTPRVVFVEKPERRPYFLPDARRRHRTIAALHCRTPSMDEEVCKNGLEWLPALAVLSCHASLLLLCPPPPLSALLPHHHLRPREDKASTRLIPREEDAISPSMKGSAFATPVGSPSNSQNSSKQTCTTA